VLTSLALFSLALINSALTRSMLLKIERLVGAFCLGLRTYRVHLPRTPGDKLTTPSSGPLTKVKRPHKIARLGDAYVLVRLLC
jgi:hypothetical protein